MFFRFAAALILVVLISMVGIALEKQSLQMKRAVSRQYFQKDLLLEMHAGLRLRIQRVTAPSQFSELKHDRPIMTNWSAPAAPQMNSSAPPPPTAHRSLPLLRWEHPAATTSSDVSR